jgi:hypothetical protein
MIQREMFFFKIDTVANALIPRRGRDLLPRAGEGFARQHRA